MIDEPTGRKQPHRWTPRKSGNLRGRAKGSRNAALLALDAIVSEAGKDITEAVVSAAKAGDMWAADILSRRLWPKRKGWPVALDLPTITVPSDIVATLGVITGAVAMGKLSPDEGAAVAGILKTQRRAVGTVDLERRLDALERAATGRNR